MHSDLESVLLKQYIVCRNLGRPQLYRMALYTVALQLPFPATKKPKPVPAWQSCMNTWTHCLHNLEWKNFVTCQLTYTFWPYNVCGFYTTCGVGVELLCFFSPLLTSSLYGLLIQKMYSHANQYTINIWLLSSPWGNTHWWWGQDQGDCPLCVHYRGKSHCCSQLCSGNAWSC